MEEMIIEPIEDFGLSKKQQQRTLFSKIGVVGCGKDGQNAPVSMGIPTVKIKRLTVGGLNA